MEAHNLLTSYGVIIKLPDLTVAVSDKPVIGASDHTNDISRLVVGGVHDDLFLNWVDCDFEEITSLSIIDVLELPPLDVAVSTSCDEKLFFLIENNDLYESIMKRCL